MTWQFYKRDGTWMKGFVTKGGIVHSEQHAKDWEIADLRALGFEKSQPSEPDHTKESEAS